MWKWKPEDCPNAAAVHAERPKDGKLRVIVFAAHPDDCDICAGGTGAMWSTLGHHVKFVSTTNGDIGHWAMAGGPLAIRRTAEVQKAAKILGATAEVLDIHDGELMPTLENRQTFTRLIRRWKADIVMAHRPNDYHPDHRYTGVLVQDTAYMVAVPFWCPDTPYLDYNYNPVFLFLYDQFQRPNPFRPDVVVAIDDAFEKKLDALMTLESQFIDGGLEGGALGYLHPPLKSEAEAQQRYQQVREGLRMRFAKIADQYRDQLIEWHGEEKGKQVRYAEAFEICEYGRQPTPDEIRQLFPFFPEKN